MKWRPYFKAKVAKTRGDRHWWTTTSAGHRVHQWASIQTLENDRKDRQILQIVLGPLMLCVAARCVDADH